METLRFQITPETGAHTPAVPPLFASTAAAEYIPAWAVIVPHFLDAVMTG
jgi:hypothetical protein